MGLLLSIAIVVLIWLWMTTSRLAGRVEHLERRLLDALDQIRDLQRREARETTIVRAERTISAPSAPAAAAAPPVTVTTKVEVESQILAPTPAPMPQPEPMAAVPAAPQSVPETTPAAEPIGVAAASASAESWEMTVGTSWFNKLGVFAFVIGLALLLKYSFTVIGPAGRVAIGFALSGTLLALGVWLERRAAFRNYAYGLVAGGWAGTYFTTFAMHDVPGAKIIDSPLMAASLLALVAAGMIAHSLRYRSQVVTSLAFVVAYATLALSPLSGFSLAASVPLALSILVVGQRLGWPSVSALGIAATYGVFVLRSQTYPGGVMDPTASPIPYATLAGYWLTFEFADLVGLRARRQAAADAGRPAVTMLALNATGALGAAIAIAPGNRPDLIAPVLFTSGTAYIASAVVRALLMPERRLHADDDRPFDVSHAATAISVALFVIAIGLRFSPTRQSLSWLLETQLLFVSGLTLRDRWLRRIGSLVAALVTVHAGLQVLTHAGAPQPLALGMDLPGIIATMVALVWFANREGLRMRGFTTAWLEPVYPWAATALIATVAWATLSPAHLALAGWVMTAALLEAGLGRDREYTLQSYCTGVAAGYATLVAFLVRPTADGLIGAWGPAPTPADEWITLPAGIAVCAIAARRLLSHRDSPRAPEAVKAAGTAVAIAVALTMTFEWRVFPAEAVAGTWAVTSLVLMLIGSWRSLAAARRLAYFVAVAASARAADSLLSVSTATASQVASASLVAAIVYAMGWLADRDPARAEDSAFARSGLLAMATGLVALIASRTFGDVTLGPAWATAGAALLATGLAMRQHDLRWHGYVLLTLGTFRAAARVLLWAEPANHGILWLLYSLAAVYIATLLARRVNRHAEMPPASREIEDMVTTMMLAGASAVLAATIVRQAHASMMTLLLALQGLGLMSTGLLTRERVLRISGLTLLLGCLLKVFVYDLRELEPLPRIFSFVVLGLVLLGISWIYTRYREQIMKLL